MREQFCNGHSGRSFASQAGCAERRAMFGASDSIQRQFEHGCEDRQLNRRARATADHGGGPDLRPRLRQRPQAIQE